MGTLTTAVPSQGEPRTLLAIFAHARDHHRATPVPNAREGVRVHLAIATNGDKGVREHAEIPAGTALAQARAAELDYACQALGI
jgi:LmbE family N-acetylglucosaminyl deacetylase